MKLLREWQPTSGRATVSTRAKPFEGAFSYLMVNSGRFLTADSWSHNVSTERNRDPSDDSPALNDSLGASG